MPARRSLPSLRRPAGAHFPRPMRCVPAENVIGTGLAFPQIAMSNSIYDGVLSLRISYPDGQHPWSRICAPADRPALLANSKNLIAATIATFTDPAKVRLVDIQNVMHESPRNPDRSNDLATGKGVFMRLVTRFAHLHNFFAERSRLHSRHSRMRRRNPYGAVAARRPARRVQTGTLTLDLLEKTSTQRAAVSGPRSSRPTAWML
jgi:hypothetical protein